MTPNPDPYDGRGLTNPDPYDGALRPLQRSAQPPTAVGTKSLKRLKNAPLAAPEGGGVAPETISEYETQVRFIVEWAVLAATPLTEWKRP